MRTLLQANITANWGSTGKIAEEIGKAAMAQGWDSYIAYGETCNPSSSHLIKVGCWANMYAHYAEQRVRDNEGRCSRLVTKRLVSKIKETTPDVVHLHNIHDHYLNYPILFGYLNQTDIKVVWTFHDFWPITGHCMHFVQSGCERWRTGCYDCPQKGQYPKALMDRSAKNWKLKKELFTANPNLTVVAVSQWVGEMAKQSFLGDKPIKIINNGVDLNVFNPTAGEMSKYGIEDGKFAILAVASQWAVDKGLEDFIAMSNLLKEDEVIVLVGVSKKIQQSLPVNIIGIERTSNPQELAALYTRADVVCSLSSAETFGLTIAEGYACGTPAVVYDNTALPYLITPETGYVVPNKDYKTAYNAIQKVREKGKAAYSEACMLLAKEKYDKDKCFAEYINLYNSLI